MRVAAGVLLLVLAALTDAPRISAHAADSLNDRDTYAVYSELMTSQTRGKPDKRLWMISARTTAYEKKHPCTPNTDDPFDHSSMINDPKLSITAPTVDEVRFQAVLDDFQKNCHEQGLLQVGKFSTDWSVRILSDNETKRFEHDLMPEDPKLLKKWPKNATGLHSFSRVFFNSDHTLAMVHSSFYCGMLCGTWEWQVLERTETGWKVLPWKHQITVS